MDLYTKIVRQCHEPREGDLYRHWSACLADGQVVERFQCVSRGNPCRIDATQIQHDYDQAGVWGSSCNAVSSMSHPVVRVLRGRATITLSLHDALDAIFPQ